MNNGLVLYKSKYGATKKYADMLQAELAYDICEIQKNCAYDWQKYDWIIFAGGIYASGIAGLDILRKNYQFLENKKLAIFCVGASPFDEKAFAEIKAHNLKENFANIPIFYGRGAWNEEKMTWKDRTLCKMLQKAISKKNPDTCEPWMKALLSSVGQVCDWTDSSYLAPLLDYIED